MTFPANETTTTLFNLNSSMLYKFYLSAKTIKGSGPEVTEEAFTIMETSEFRVHEGSYPPVFKGTEGLTVPLPRHILGIPVRRKPFCIPYLTSVLSCYLSLFVSS